MTLQSYGEIYSKRRVIREFLEFGNAHQQIALDENTSLVFTQIHNQCGLCLRSANFHVSFLAKAAYLLLALKNSIYCAYMDLTREAELIPRKIEKIMKIIVSGFKSLGETFTLEDLLESDKVNKNSILENDLLSIYFDEIFHECSMK